MPVAWLFGVLSGLLSVLLFYGNGYYGSMVLNAIYVLQGILGYFHWKWLNPDLKVAYRFNLLQHLFIVLLCPLIALLFLSVFGSLGFKDLYFWDLLFAAGSIVATWLEIRKDIACWIYWMVCNSAYAVLYWVNLNGLEPMYLYAALMLFLAVFSGFAMRTWLKNR